MGIDTLYSIMIEQIVCRTELQILESNSRPRDIHDQDIKARQSTKKETIK